MKYQLLVQPQAESEIADAFFWYETQDEGLGNEFLRAVDVCLSAIQRHPMSYPLIYKQIRRALVRKFPYGIFYLIERDRIVIVACFHVRRDPKQWLRRV